MKVNAKKINSVESKFEKFNKRWSKFFDAGLVLLPEMRKGDFEASDIADYEAFMDCIKHAIDMFMNGEIDDADISVFSDECETFEDTCECSGNCINCSNSDDDDCDECYECDEPDLDEDICECNSDFADGNNTPPDILMSDFDTFQNYRPGMNIVTFSMLGFTFSTYIGNKPCHCGNVESSKFPIYTQITKSTTGQVITCACACIRGDKTFHTEIFHDAVNVYNMIKRDYTDYVPNNPFYDYHRKSEFMKLVGDSSYTFTTSLAGMCKTTVPTVQLIGILTNIAAYMQAMHFSFDQVFIIPEYEHTIEQIVSLFNYNYEASVKKLLDTGTSESIQ